MILTQLLTHHQNKNQTFKIKGKDYLIKAYVNDLCGMILDLSLGNTFQIFLAILEKKSE